MSGVYGVSAKEIACVMVLKDALLSHRLIKENIEDEALESMAREVCAHINEDYLTFFVIITDRNMAIGRWCLINNHIVDDLVTAGDVQGLIEHIKRGRANCPEILDNSELTDEQYRALVDELKLQRKSIQSAIANYRGDETKIVPDLMKQAYHTVCVSEQKGLASFSYDRQAPIFDHPPGDVTPIKCCFDIVQLVAIVDKSTREGKTRVINPCTRRPFDPSVFDHVRRKYGKELAMMSRYHSWLAETTMKPIDYEVDRRHKQLKEKK